MLTRIVKMKFKPEKVGAFEQKFISIKEKIRNQSGCHSVVLFQDQTDSSIFFTYSIWSDASDLERYRNSDFFKQTWQHTKQLFDAKPEAWSLNEIIKI